MPKAPEAVSRVAVKAKELGSKIGSHQSLHEADKRQLSAEEAHLLTLVKSYQIALEDKKDSLTQKLLGELYELNVDKIYRYILYRVGNQNDAEDLTAEVFLRMSRNLHRYESDSIPFSAWLYRIAHNLAANKIRDRARADKHTTQLPEPAEEPSGDVLEPASDLDTADQALANIQRQELHAAIAKLSEKYQELLYLKLAGYSNEEIGSFLDKTEGAIKSLYHRATLALKRTMN